MNLRERLTQNKLVGTTAAGALILIGITIIVLQMRSNSSAPAAAPAQAFFSIGPFGSPVALVSLAAPVWLAALVWLAAPGASMLIAS